MVTEISTRHATQADIPLILSFLEKKAEFDRSMGAFEGVLQATEEKLCQSLFGSVPFAKVLFGELLGNAIGFALYYFRFSSFAARPSLWLDDLYVDSEARSQGVGSILMKTLVQIAEETHCTHLTWTASANNTRGVNFYQRIGAEIIDRKVNTLFFKLNTNTSTNLSIL